MKDKYTINLILISSKWLTPFFGVCSWWINSSSKNFHHLFSGVLHWGSTWWFIKDSLHSSIVLQHFSRSYDPPSYTLKINMVLNTCFVLRSSSILHLAFQSAIPSILSLRWCYVILDNFSSCSMIHKLSRMRYFKIVIFSSIMSCFNPS